MTIKSFTSDMPNIWGEGSIFGFSGMDGQSVSAAGFVTTFAESRYSLLIHTPRKRLLRINCPDAGIVRVATGDVLVVDMEQGQLVLVWSAWHTLIGTLPEGVTAELTFADEPGECPVDGITYSADGDNDNVVAMMVESSRFSLAYGPSDAVAGSRCEAGLTTDPQATIDARLKPYSKLPALGDPARNRLLRKAFSIMKVNSLTPEMGFKRRWSTPDRVPHKHMWLWDSVFHSFAMNHVDPVLAHDYLRSVLDTLWTKSDAEAIGKPDQAGLIGINASLEGRNGESTQPPVLAWGILENVKRLDDISSLSEDIPSLEAYLDWDLNYRDANSNGLLEWKISPEDSCRCGESGMDNSPRFDCAQALDAVDFSVFAANDMYCLAELCSMAGDAVKADIWTRRAQKMEHTINQLLWSEKDGFYYDRKMDGELSEVKAVSGFLPLLLKNIPSSRLARLLDMFQSSHFDTKYPIASVAATTPAFGTDMWRGPAWLNTNYIIIEGLKRHGEIQQAEYLREKSIEMVLGYYEEFGVFFEFYDTTGQTPPTKCDRKGPPCGAPYLTGKVDNIRDYHWTAAITLCLLLEK